MVNIDDPKPVNLVGAPDLTVPAQSVENVLRRTYAVGGKPEGARAMRRRLAKEARRGR